MLQMAGTGHDSKPGTCAPHCRRRPVPAADREQPTTRPMLEMAGRRRHPTAWLGVPIAAYVALGAATPVVRAQNALQHFAECMGGPAQTAAGACTGFDVHEMGSINLLATISVQQPAKNMNPNGSCMAEGDLFRDYNRLIITPIPVPPATTSEVDGLSAYITIDRKHDFCDPPPPEGSVRASASVAGIYLNELDSPDPYAAITFPSNKRWIGLGYMAGRNLHSLAPGDEVPGTTGAFTKVWYELITDRAYVPQLQEWSVATYYTRRFRDMPSPDYDINPVVKFTCQQAEGQAGEWIVRYPDISGIVEAVESVAGDYAWNGHSATRAILQGETFNPGDKLPGVPWSHVQFVLPEVRFAYASELGFVAIDLAAHADAGFAYVNNTHEWLCGFHSGLGGSGSSFHIWQGCPQ